MFLNQDRHCTLEISSLIEEDENTFSILSKLTKELQDKSTAELSSYQLLNHTEWKSIVFGIFRLLSHESIKICGNAAYIIGSICKYEIGKMRVTDLLVEKQIDETDQLLSNFNKLLSCKQDECVLNALSAVANIADSNAGRIWLLRKFELDETMELICRMRFLQSNHPDISGNASLFVASHVKLIIGELFNLKDPLLVVLMTALECGRSTSACIVNLNEPQTGLTVDEEGCARLLNTKQRKSLILQLIECLLQKHPDCAMNAASVLGRLLQLESCQKSLLLMKQADSMIANLFDLVFSEDIGCRKNSSFALQSIASASQGCHKLLQNQEIDKLLSRFIELLQDEEISMFAIYFIQSFVLHSKGCIYVRDHPTLKQDLLENYNGGLISAEVKEELKNVCEFIADIPKPQAPIVKVESATSVTITWGIFQHKNGLSTIYHLYQDDSEVYVGDETQHVITSLKPMNAYTFHIKLSSEGAESKCSENTSVTMPESVPSAPTHFHVAHRTTSQLKIVWEEPTEWNGEVKGYVLLHTIKGRDIKEIELPGTSHVFINLQADTEYHFEVCACTCQGRGPTATLTASTNSLAMYAPSKPITRVLGRTEINIQWDAPHYPQGRLNYYDLRMNDTVIYRGIDRSFTARRLTPGKEYSFKISAWTSEGRCESEPTTRKTPRQNYCLTNLKKSK